MTVNTNTQQQQNCLFLHVVYHSIAKYCNTNHFYGFVGFSMPTSFFETWVLYQNYPCILKNIIKGTYIILFCEIDRFFSSMSHTSCLYMFARLRNMILGFLITILGQTRSKDPSLAHYNN